MKDIHILHRDGVERHASSARMLDEGENCLACTVGILNPLDENNNLIHAFDERLKKARYLEVEGIWDTGATKTVIHATIAEALGLMPVGKGDALGRVAISLNKCLHGVMSFN
ncbi:MAG: hypothetical protein OYH77_08060 [Pseudomonadota bacterium]|nr:hypothetical protein [Pseudomonadota bacterium]